MKLSKIFDNHMVFQSGIPVLVWGWAEKGEEINVKFSGQRKKTVTEDNGCWSVRLDPMKPDFSPHSMTITGKETLCLKDILVGEVWLCAGQSNMGYPMMKLDCEIDPVPGVRLFHCQPHANGELHDDFAEGEWASADSAHSETMSDFSIIGFLFGKELREKLNVPIGMVDVSRAASVAESWTPFGDLKKMGIYPQIELELEKIDTSDFNVPGYLYNNSVNPLVSFAIASVLWYQGESNSIRSNQYAKLIETMIASWRERWNQGDFPFISVQLPNYDNSSGAPPCCSGSWQQMREAQLQILKLQNTALVVTIDIGDSEDLHPANKPEVAHRMALAALGAVYRRNIVYSGPIYKSMKLEGGAIRLTFDHTGTGLMAKNGNLRHFEIAGDNMRFFPAKAEIDKNSVIVFNKSVKMPIAVRYAWSNDPIGCNLYNKEGLPASPFRTS